MINLEKLCADLQDPQSLLRKESDRVICELYARLGAPSGKTYCVLEAWKEDFRYLYGDVRSNLSSNRKLRPEKILEKYGIGYSEEGWPQEISLLFLAIQTYFSLLIKCLMAEILTESNGNVSYEDILYGGYAERAGVRNYISEDWYCWPAYEDGSWFGRVMKGICGFVSEYSEKLSAVDFVREHPFDYIKQMYEAMIPRELRHALGEYYTPDWLAEATLREICRQDGVEIGSAAFLDPTCGSGTFLLQTILAKRAAGVGLEQIVKTVCGFDINPLAILTAKTNYLLTVLDLLDPERPITLPIYHVDVVRLGEERLGTFDVIIGNPPWVNWEYLPESYRIGCQHKWVDYGLFSAKGRELGFSKEDISVLITYIVMDVFLKRNGILGFVIRQGVFKSAQNGVGFRRFRIKDDEPIKVLRVDDLSGIKAFENAVTSTALFFARKGEQTEYPVPYFLWEKRDGARRGCFGEYSKLEEVLDQVVIRSMLARPAVEEDKTSVWMTGSKESLETVSGILGTNDYRARTGVFTGGANAVYWLQLRDAEDDRVRAVNVVDRAKRKVQPISVELENTYVFPMLRGSGVRKWKVSYDTYLLCPHTRETKMWPVPAKDLEQDAPRTMAYLRGFREMLDGRKGFAGWEKKIRQQEFHTVLRVGEYTFSPYKVVWKYIASEFVCAVIGTVDDPYLGPKKLLPNEKVMYVSLDDETEAYYLCGILSSTCVAECVRSYMNPTSISAHVLNKLRIPRYDKDNADHREIARLCKAGHGQKDIEKTIREIDRIAERIYHIEREESQ